MATASRNSQAATNWAQKRKEQLERAKLMKDERFHGDPTAQPAPAQDQWHDQMPIPARAANQGYARDDYPAQPQPQPQYVPGYHTNDGSMGGTYGRRQHQDTTGYDYQARQAQNSYYGYQPQGNPGGYYDPPHQTQAGYYEPHYAPGNQQGMMDRGYATNPPAARGYANPSATMNASVKGAQAPYGYGRSYSYEERSAAPQGISPGSHFSMADLKKMSPDVCKEVLLRMLEEDHSLIRSVRGHVQTVSGSNSPGSGRRRDDRESPDPGMATGPANPSRRRSGRSRSANIEQEAEHAVPANGYATAPINSAQLRPSANSASSAASAPANLNSNMPQQSTRGDVSNRNRPQGANAEQEDANYVPSNASMRRRHLPQADGADEEGAVLQAAAKVKQRSKRGQESRRVPDEQMNTMDSYAAQGNPSNASMQGYYQHEAEVPQDTASGYSKASSKPSRGPKTSSRGNAQKAAYVPEPEPEPEPEPVQVRQTQKRAEAGRNRPGSGSNRMQQALEYGKKMEKGHPQQRQEQAEEEEEQDERENDGGYGGYEYPEEGEDDGGDAEGEGDVEKVECGSCGRRFAVDRIKVHERVCSKVSKKQRKIFDPTKQRLEPDALKLFKEAQKKEKKSQSQGQGDNQPQKLAKWKRDRMNFINAIRAAKGGGGAAQAEPLYAGAAEEDDGMKACPHCARKFNENAADRHIPICAKLQTKSKPSGKAPAAAAAPSQNTAMNARAGSKQSAPASKSSGPSNGRGTGAAASAIRVR